VDVSLSPALGRLPLGLPAACQLLQQCFHRPRHPAFRRARQFIFAHRMMGNDAHNHIYHAVSITPYTVFPSLSKDHVGNGIRNRGYIRGLAVAEHNKGYPIFRVSFN